MLLKSRWAKLEDGKFDAGFAIETALILPLLEASHDCHEIPRAECQTRA
ncbi:MAG TPA: hypothetical protein VF627_02035 [Abditibacterium sp.]|jgi:hypothetical protein